MYTFQEGEAVNMEGLCCATKSRSAMVPSPSLTRALYHTMDVTAAVNSAIRGGVLHLTGNFNGYFGDPNPGYRKALVLTTSDGSTTFWEGEEVRMAVVAGGNGPEVEEDRYSGG